MAHHCCTVLPCPDRRVEEVVKLVLLTQRLDSGTQLVDTGQEHPVITLELSVLALDQQTRHEHCLSLATREGDIQVNTRQVGDGRHQFPFWYFGDLQALFR